MHTSATEWMHVGGAVQAPLTVTSSSAQLKYSFFSSTCVAETLCQLAFWCSAFLGEQYHHHFRTELVSRGFPALWERSLWQGLAIAGGFESSWGIYSLLTLGAEGLVGSLWLCLSVGCSSTLQCLLGLLAFFSRWNCWKAVWYLN